LLNLKQNIQEYYILNEIMAAIFIEPSKIVLEENKYIKLSNKNSPRNDIKINIYLINEIRKIYAKSNK
jgi:hypothetical protein